MTHRIILGDCLEVMKTFPDNHFSAVVTDPPYGLSFMGKGWDHAVPQVSYWEEAFRISKPGSFLISMGGTRTFHRLCCAIEDAGWEIRDCISWIYGSGFPKSHNNFGISGYGTALKPAWEPCIVAMKPCDGTFKHNAEKWGQAGINIDGCRIETTESLARPYGGDNDVYGEFKMPRGTITGTALKGRWPTNVIFDEEAGRMLDEQSGTTKSSNKQRNNAPSLNTCMSGANTGHVSYGHSDFGGASRFFYCAKTSSRERNEGLGDKKSTHPTVKPLKLMEYLIRLVMPPSNGILLDPFAGSGSTILAAKRLGFDAIGIEKQEEYCEIARARISNFHESHQQQMDMFG